MLKIIPLVLSYFLGSIPFGFLITYFVKKIDIRNFGSGNIGATNVVRVAGKKWGILVFILDLLKGFLALLITYSFFPPAAVPFYYYIFSAAAAVFGHNWTPFLGFKGGKGVAVSLGSLIGLTFIFSGLGIILVLSLVVWIVVFFIFRYVSLASIFAAANFFACSWIISTPKEIKILSFFIFMFILARHKKNINRLFARQEHRF